MIAETMPANDQQRYKYGGGIITLMMGVVFAYAMFYAYEPFTSGRVEWHLYLKSLPPIPHPIMVGLWWAGTAISLLVVALSLTQAVSVFVDDEKIVAQSIYTRKFKTVYYRDILDATLHKSYINITDRHNTKIYLAKLFMSSAAFKTISGKLRSATQEAH